MSTPRRMFLPLIAVLLAGCSPAATTPAGPGLASATQTAGAGPTMSPPTERPPTATPAPRTETPAPPTATPAPPTATPAPPTATPAPPIPTLAPPTATLAPPTATLAPQTATLAPAIAANPTVASPNLVAAPTATRTAVLVASVPAASQVLPGAAPVLGVLPVITERHKQIYLNSVSGGKNLRLFTVVGDCNSQPSVYVRRMTNGEFDIGSLSPGLRATADWFGQSFSRISLAAGGGFTSATMNDKVWADGALCGTTQTPFECEVWVSRSSVVFIQVGTGDQYIWRSFEANYRPMIEHALRKGVVPVLLTKADDLETRDGGAPAQYINDIVRRLAREYGVPLIDFWLATRSLPNNGLLDEGDLDFHLSPAGMDLHMLLTLQVLDAFRR